MVRYLDNNNSGFNSWVASRTGENKKPRFVGLLWWIVIFALAWWLFSVWMTPKQDTAIGPQPTDINSAAESIANVPMLRVESEKINVSIQGLRISKIELSDYSETKDSDKKITLLSTDNEFAEIGFIANGTAAPTADTNWNRGVGMTWRNADGVEFLRTVEVKDYVVSVRDEIKNNSKRDFSIAPYARIVRNPGADSTGVATGGIVFENNSIERESWKSIGKESYAWTSPTGFVGFEEQYWQTILSLDASDQTMKIKPLSNGRVQAESSAAPISVAAGKTVTLTTNLFTGPKTPDVLNAGSSAIAGINQTIDYGWFWFLSRPFLWALNALHGLVLNYGLAIILLTIGMRILMWPLTRKSFVGMAAMQKMQPEIQRIQKLYGNDKMRMQQEMMRVYRESKTSPMSGCLPMLLQIPIFFALYKALLIAVPLRQAGFLWISDLAVMDPFFILPVLMGATMWWQQHLQTSVGGNKNLPDDPMAQTQKVMKWMPVLFTALFAWMPAGLVLYWTVSNLFGIGQMWWIKRQK